jgi:multiple sugar transport system ATP-binding protein
VRIGELAFPAPPVNAAQGQEVTYGIRPEHLSLAGTDGMPFALEVVEPTGAATELFGTVAGQACCVMMNGRTDVLAGTTISLLADPARALVFDRTSGRRLR